MEERTDRQRRFAFALGWALREKAWSAAELARAVGVSNSTTLRWIAGTHVPDILTTKVLAKALGVKPEFLYDPPEVPPYPFAEYLVSEATAAGLEEGTRKAPRRPRRAAGEAS